MSKFEGWESNLEGIYTKKLPGDEWACVRPCDPRIAGKAWEFFLADEYWQIYDRQSFFDTAEEAIKAAEKAIG